MGCPLICHCEERSNLIPMIIIFVPTKELNLALVGDYRCIGGITIFTVSNLKNSNMKKVEKSKIWRVNVLAVYWNEGLTRLNRPRIHELLSNLACLYRLEFSITSEFQPHGAIGFDEQPNSQNKYDLLYFRSTSLSPISAQDFRAIVNSVFSKGYNPFVDGIEVGTMKVNLLPHYPFPDNYQVFGY